MNVYIRHTVIFVRSLKTFRYTRRLVLPLPARTALPDNKHGGAAVQLDGRLEGEEEEEGQKEAESEEMRWGGFKEALQRQQEVVVVVVEEGWGLRISVSF